MAASPDLHWRRTVHQSNVDVIHDEMTLEPGVIVEESPIGTLYFGPAPVGMVIRKVFDGHHPIYVHVSRGR